MSRSGRNTFDVAVIGLGAMGAAAACEIARRGARLVGLEQLGIPHGQGSHHGESRMIRQCYYEHPSYVPLLKRAYELWERLQRDSGRSLLHVTSGLFMGLNDEPGGELVPGILRAAAEHDLPHERLGADHVRERYPMFHLPPGYEGVHEPMAGLLRPEVAIEAFADIAMRHGATLKGHEPAVHWRINGSSVFVETPRGRYQVRHLVICGGAWANRLIGEIGVRLGVTRQVLGWFWPKAPELFEMGRFPVWGMDAPDGHGLLYGFPILPGGGRPGVKIARHFPAHPVTPETVDRQSNEDDRHEIEQIIATVFPEHAGPVLSLATCLYTCTPDAHFIIDSHPDSSNVTIAAGFSGHGFKFASVVGEVLADLALDSATRHPIDFLRLGRFR